MCHQGMLHDNVVAALMLALLKQQHRLMLGSLMLTLTLMLAAKQKQALTPTLTLMAKYSWRIVLMLMEFQRLLNSMNN